MIYDYKAHPTNGPTGNLFAYSEEGKLLRNGEAFSEMNSEPSVSIISESPLVASNFVGYDVIFDFKTGKVVNLVFTK